MSNTGTVKLKTEHLLLRKFHLRDVFYFLNWFRRAKGNRYSQGRAKKTVRESLSFFVRKLCNYYFKHRNKHYFWAIVRGGRMIGFVGFNERQDDIYHIYYKISDDCWGQGYASEAVSAVMEYMDTQDVKAIVGGCDTNNVASYKILEKNGFRFLKMREDVYRYADGRTGNMAFFRYK